MSVGFSGEHSMWIWSTFVPKGRVVFPVDSWSSVNSRLEESKELSRVIDCESDIIPESERR